MSKASSTAGFRADLRDAVTPKAFAYVVAVLLLQLGFVLSYIGAFHDPRPHRIEIGLVAPQQVAATSVQRLNALDGAPLSARVVGNEQQAREQIRSGDLSAALVVDPQGTSDRLLVASGGGASTATAVESVVAAVEKAQDRTVTTDDVVPLQAGDGRGLSGFYLVVGWMVGGYLVASLLGVAGGARPATTRRAAIRLGALVPYAVLSGLGGAVIAGPVLGAIDGHTVALWWLGALIVFAAAAATTALQVLFGILGIGLAVLLFVVLGNPSAGGAYQDGVLPAFWRGIGNALPNGAGTDAVRRIVYFDGNGIGGHLLVIALWAVVGVVVALVAAARHARSATAEPVGRHERA
ncbi:DUF3533 domain-containing protein [Jatrophihabitans fulvus]